MSQPIPSLHQLVASLVTDRAAQTAFLTDPTAVLANAGLSEITGADAREATAAVTSHLPAPVAGELHTVLAALPALGVDGLHGAIAHLHCLAEHAHSLPVGDFGDFGDFGALTTGTTATSETFASTFAYTSEHLDAVYAEGISPEGATFTGQVVSDAAHAAGSAAASAEGFAGTFAYGTQHAEGALAGAAGTEGIALSSATTTEQGSAAGSLAASKEGLAVAGAVTTDHAGFSGALAASEGSFVGTVATTTPLGSYGFSTDHLGHDLGSSLDADALGHAVPSGAVAGGDLAAEGQSIAGAVASNAASVAGPAAAVPGAGHVVAAGGSELAGHLGEGTEALSGAFSHVPAAPLPSALPADLPGHIIAGAPAVADQHLTAVAHDAASGAAAHSPLAGLDHSALGAIDHAAVLPDVTDALHTDIPLGH